MKTAKTAYPDWFAPTVGGKQTVDSLPQYAPFESHAKQHADVVKAAATYNDQHLKTGNWFPTNSEPVKTTRSFNP